jgi:hypothetical protein
MGLGIGLVVCFTLIHHMPVVVYRGPLNSLEFLELKIVTVSRWKVTL